MNVKLNLIILHLDILTATSSCLLEDGKIVSRSPLTTNVDGELRDILLKYLEIKPDWVTFSLVDVKGTKDGIYIYYSCLVPTLIKNKLGEWVDLGAIDDKENKRLVFQAGQKLSFGHSTN